MGEEGGALPDYDFLFLFSLFPVQQTTSGIGHRVIVVFFGFATNQQLYVSIHTIALNRYNKCHEEVLYLQSMIPT